MLPETGRPKGGDWDTGYVTVKDKLIVFMNIGVSGTTGHDFENYYDNVNKTIVWYGKPRSHSKQQTFQKLIKRETTPYFFARWNNKDPFTYLGIGKIVSFKDGIKTRDSKNNIVDTIEVKLTIEDSEFIIKNINPESSDETIIPKIKSSFVLEKYLENYILNNWTSTALNEKYNIYEKDGKKGYFYPTRPGPIDILAISKDDKEFLVIEFKKGRSCDDVIRQITSYMEYVSKNIASKNQTVKGVVITLEDDQNLKDTINAMTNINFMRYELKFDLMDN